MANGIQNGVFVPSTNIWDVEQLLSVDVQSPEFKELLVRLYQNINTICLALNIKDTGQYQLAEFVNGQNFFPNPANNTSTLQLANDRQVFRKVIDFGALPNATTKDTAHGIFITTKTRFTRIYAVATNPGSAFIPIPFVGVGPDVANQAEISIGSVYVHITTSWNASAYTTCYVILEYIQD